MDKRIILIFIIVLGLLLRLPHIVDKEKGTDEKLSIRNSREIFQSNPFTNPMPPEVNPPLFFVILGIFMRIYDSVILLRTVMVAISIISILVLYLLIKKIWDKKFALFVSLFYAVTPMHIIFAQHIRAYVFLFLLFILSLYFLYDYVIKEKTRSVFVLTVIYIVSIYTHYFSILFILGHIATVGVFYFIKKRINIKYYLASLAVLVISAIPLLFLIKKQYLPLVTNSPHEALNLLIIPYPFYKMSIMLDLSTAITKFPYLLIIPCLIGVLFFLGILLLWHKDKDRFLFCVINFFVPFLVLGMAGLIVAVYSFRYLVFLLPLLTTIFCFSLYNLKNKKLKWGLIILILVGWAIAIGYYYSIAAIYHWPIDIAL